MTCCPCFPVLQPRGLCELRAEARSHLQLKTCLHNKLKVANGGGNSDFVDSDHRFIIKTAFKLAVLTA